MQLLSEDNTTLPSEVEWLAKQGRKLFPLRSLTKRPMFEGWQAKATGNLDQLRSWAKQYPGCNWAMATGRPSGLVIVDADGELGRANYAALHLPPTLSVITGRADGGRHYYFLLPEEVSIGNSADKLGEGLDVRGEGGYVAVPGSVHPDTGKLYAFDETVETEEAIEAPQWLLDRLATSEHPASAPAPASRAEPTDRDRIYAGQALQDECRDVECAAPGTRNDRLNRAAYSLATMVGAGWLTREQVYERLWESCADYRAAEGDDEAQETILSGLNAGIKKPREPLEPPARPQLQAAALDSAVTSLPRGAIQVISSEGRPWPAPMGEDAYYGLVGEYVHAWEPCVEGDPQAIMLCTLVSIGCMLGRHSSYPVGATRHYPNLFTMVCGESAFARKGTATDAGTALIRKADPAFETGRKKGSLSSGQGLIHAIRDASPASGDKKGDSGVSEKRFLAVQGEFGGVLRAAKQKDNTLTAVLRDAWDGKPLGTITKAEPTVCNEPHVSVIGNITVEELKECLSESDKWNGIANRILWCCARNDKELPFGSVEPDGQVYGSIIARLKDALAKARTIRQVGWAEETKPLWKVTYSALRAGRETGELGSILARADVQIIRMAMIYALLDSSPFIRPAHLRAALAVWRYCEASARYIFGNEALPIGATPSLEQRLLKTMGRTKEEMSRSQLYDAFARNIKADALAAALEKLINSGQVTARTVQGEGRPKHVYTLTERP